MDETLNTTAGADTARGVELHTVSDAVAELERREKARAAERKATKAAAAATEGDDNEPEDRRQVEAEDDDEADKKDKRKAKKAAESDDEGDDEADDDEDSADDGESEDDEDDDDESEDDDDEAEDEKPKAKKKAEAPPAKLKINLGDREVEATPDEVSAYVREARTEREQIAQTRQQIQGQAQALQQQGQMLAQMAQAMLGAEPDLQLAQSDPGAYIAQQALYRQRMQALQTLQGHTQQAAQQAQATQQQAQAEFVQRERLALLKAMPELADPVKLSSFNGRIAKVAQKYGLSAQELSSAFDHRSYLMLRDLARLADMEAERGNVRQKLKGAPPLKVPEQRAATGQRNTSDLKAKDAKRAFMKSGRTLRDVKAYLAATDR